MACSAVLDSAIRYVIEKESIFTATSCAIHRHIPQNEVLIRIANIHAVASAGSNGVISNKIWFSLGAVAIAGSSGEFSVAINRNRGVRSRGR